MNNNNHCSILSSTHCFTDQGYLRAGTESIFFFDNVTMTECNLAEGQHQNSREIPYLYIVKIDGGGKFAYLDKRISLFPLRKGNSAVMIDRGGGQDVYLYNVKIGNFPEMLMSSLIVFRIGESFMP